MTTTTPKVTEHPLETQVLLEDVDKIYSEDDKEYISFIQSRLEKAYRLNDQTWTELGNKTRKEIYEENAKVASTLLLNPKKNTDDVNISSGTIEQKLEALLSHINGLNIETEVLAFDRDNNKINDLGVALTDIVHDTKIREAESDNTGDEEKRMARQRELLVHGVVYVQESWIKKWETKKKLSTTNWNGEFSDVDWSEKLEKVFEGPTKKLLHPLNVYLGDMTEMTMEEQPFVFTIIHKSYDAARSVYGKFENWNYVEKGKLPASINKDDTSMFNNKWRMTDLGADQVEIVMYQDKRRDEFQIIINGVYMLPIGFPLSAVSAGGEYSIVKQIFRMIQPHFALGKAFVASGSIKNISELIDEMLKLFVLKTRMSIMPPYVNTSGRVIDRKVLNPGRISMGFDPGSLTPITQNSVQGVTAGEQAWLNKMEDYMSQSTVSDQFTGQANQGTQTATETLQLQSQSQLSLSLTIGVCTLLEKKLDYLRLLNVLDNYFEPIGEKVTTLNGARTLIKEFRTTNREVAIEGAGAGERKVIPIDGPLPNKEVIRGLEREDEKRLGMPVRKIFLNPTALKAAKLFWYVVAAPKEKEGSPLFKLMFREYLNDILTVAQFGSVPNKEGIEEELAKVWGKQRGKVFSNASPAPAQSEDGTIRTPAQQDQAAGRSGGAIQGLPAGALAGATSGSGVGE